MTSPAPIRLKIPRQELDGSRFFATEEQAVSDWIAALPMANLGHTTRHLYQALSELNRVRLLPGKRMAILELLRQPIHYVGKCLSKHYLNQPIVMPDQPRKVAELATALHSQLATAYTIVATHTAALGKKSTDGKPDELIAKALQRAITEHTLNMQRHFQLYQSVTEGVWQKIHQFYTLARQHKLKDKRVADEEFGDSSVEGSYIRALLMGSCRPNQLRQEDFKGIVRAMNGWANKCSISSTQADSLLVVDPGSDKPPLYRQLHKALIEEHWLSLDTHKLVSYLSALDARTDQDRNHVKDKAGDISRDLLHHLVQCWQHMNKRTFTRLDSPSGAEEQSLDTLEITIGLSATHHFVSGELSFEALVEERGAKTFTMQQENPFLKTPSRNEHRDKDVWDTPYEANVGDTDVALESMGTQMRGNEARNTGKEKNKYRSHTVTVINSSAHGYCVAWPTDAEAQIRTGEIIGVRQSNSHNWSIAVIRWVSHENKQHTQLGLELISPSGAPYGARVIRKAGENAEFMRVLVLPEMPATNTPVTVLTPRVPFRSGQRVLLNQRAKELQIHLVEKINSGGSYQHFVFRRSAHPNGKDQADSADIDEFNSVWGNL